MNFTDHNEKYIKGWTKQLEGAKAKAFIIIGQSDDGKICVCHLDNFDGREIATHLVSIADNLLQAGAKQE